MATDNVTPIRPTADAAAWRRGVVLAIELLEEIEERAIEASLHAPGDGGEHDNMLLRYLECARGAGPLIERSFCAVLSDVLADHQADLEALHDFAMSDQVVRRYATNSTEVTP